MLTSSEQQDLAGLLHDSSRAAPSSRSALCTQIGVNAGRLTFMQVADDDFAIQLVAHLLRTHRYDTLVNLCKELEEDLGGDLKRRVIEIRKKLFDLASAENDRELAKLYKQQVVTKDERTRAELDRRASDTAQQAQVLEDKGRPIHEKLDESIRQIKLERAATEFERTYERIKQRGGAALFVLHPSLEYGGDWLLERIRELIGKTAAPLLNPTIQDFSSSLSWEFGFLRGLGQYYGVEPEQRDIMPSDEELDRYRDAIISKITAAQVASRILIEVRQADQLFGTDGRALEWFLNRFWEPLVKAVNEVISTRKMIVLAILVVDSKVPRGSLPRDRCCRANNFDSMRPVELRLRPCTVEDIVEWFTDQLQLETQHAERDAQICFRASHGKQQNIYRWVLRYKSGAST